MAAIGRAVVPQRRMTAAVTTASALIMTQLTQLPSESLPRAHEVTPLAISHLAIEDARRVIFSPTREAEARDLPLSMVIGPYQDAVGDVAQQLAHDPDIRTRVLQGLQQHLGQPPSNGQTTELQITELVEHLRENGGGGNNGGNVETMDDETATKDDETASIFTKLAITGAIVLIVGAIVVYAYPAAVTALSSMWESIWTSSALAEMVGGASGGATAAATGAADAAATGAATTEAATGAATTAAGAGGTGGFWGKLSVAVLSLFFINTKQK